MDDLKGKVVLITGASTGIGAACAAAFGALGCKVVVHYNSSRPLHQRSLKRSKRRVVRHWWCKVICAAAVSASGSSPKPPGVSNE